MESKSVLEKIFSFFRIRKVVCQRRISVVFLAISNGLRETEICWRKMMTNVLCDRPEAAAFLRVSLRTLDRLRDLGDLKWVRIAGCVRFKAEDLEQFVREHTVDANHRCGMSA
jgi:hypothetical protein